MAEESKRYAVSEDFWNEMEARIMSFFKANDIKATSIDELEYKTL